MKKIFTFFLIIAVAFTFVPITGGIAFASDSTQQMDNTEPTTDIEVPGESETPGNATNLDETQLENVQNASDEAFPLDEEIPEEPVPPMEKVFENLATHGGYDAVQGGCTDGVYAYYAMNRHQNNRSIIIKVRISNWTIVEKIGFSEVTP